jgi:hypothetical protein
MTDLDTSPGDESGLDWLWFGYLARGQLTLLTSLWKAGKTTLLAGLLRQLETGGTFLGQSCQPARVLVISEESRAIWSARQKIMSIGQHVRLLPRPFPARPSPADWARLVEFARSLRDSGELDLIVVDTLTSFLPGKSDSDPATVLEFLHPLRGLAASGVAVLVMHHPRRKQSDEGCASRGSGALPAFVDIILELHPYGKLRADECRRYLSGLSRSPETPRKLVYQWRPGTAEFEALPDAREKTYHENWPTIETILADRKTDATHNELMADWPEDLTPPSRAIVYRWLQRATAEKKVIRCGQGTKSDPYRYRLRNENDDFVDSLPPIPDLPPLRPW